LKNKIVFKTETSQNCEDLIKKLLTKDKNQRIKMKEIFSHPWIVSFEKEMFPEDVSTNPSASSNVSIKEFKKQFGKEKQHSIRFDIKEDIERRLSVDEEMVIKEEGNLFDRVLSKVQTKKKAKLNTAEIKAASPKKPKLSLVKCKSNEENYLRFNTENNIYLK